MSVKSRAKDREVKKKKYTRLLSWFDIRKHWSVYLTLGIVFGVAFCRHQKYGVLEDDYQTTRAVVYKHRNRSAYYSFYVSDVEFTGVGSGSLHVGDTIDVRYYPADPRINQPEEFFEHWHW